MLSKIGDNQSQNLMWYSCPVCHKSLEDGFELSNHLVNDHKWTESKAQEEMANQSNLIHNAKE